jgi:hypothetical protein
MPPDVFRSLAIGSCVVAILLTPCGTASARPHLSRGEVVALAEAQARRVMPHTNLAEYRCVSVRYLEDKHSWYVGYQHKKVSSTWFDVVVDDRTREAAVVME